MGCLSIAGARGTGKTTLARALLARRVKHRSRFGYDPMDEYGAAMSLRASSPSDLSMLIRDYEDPDTGERHYPRVSVRIVPADSEFEIPCVEELCQWAEWHSIIRGGGPLTPQSVLVVDEAHTVAHTSVCPPILERQAKKGRHWGLDVWCVSQRPVDISPNLRAELDSSECWYLRLVEERDLSMLRARRGRDFADRVLYLPNMHALRLLPTKRAAEEWKVEHGRNGAAPTLTRVA